MDEYDEWITNMETTTSQIDQYIRRENLEISGIPSSTPQHELEGKVIDIFNDIIDSEDGENIMKSDLVACHRLKKEKHELNPKVIVRVLNRKTAVKIHQNKKKLGNNWRNHGPNPIYISENLCPSNRKIFEVARGLKKNNHIYSCWSQNGTINIKLKESDSNSVKIHHMSEFEQYFSLKVLGWE